MVALPAFATWLMVASPHFEIVTDSGSILAREVLAGLERMRTALAPQGTPLPVRCFLFRHRADFDPLRPSPITTAFYQGGPDRDYLVAAADAAPISRRQLFHEYVHLVLNHNSHSLPKWADEGLAEYYSTMEFTSTTAVVGKPVARHLQVLKQPTRLSGEDLIAVTAESSEYEISELGERFYAHSWAAAHAYASAHGGRPPLTAPQFSVDNTRDYLARFRSAVSHPTFTWAVVAAPSPSFAENALTETEAALYRVDLALRSGKTREAERILTSLAGSAPKSPIIDRQLALVAAERGDRSEAVRRFEAAIASPAADAEAFFEYAVYLQNNEGPEATVAGLLTQTAARNPQHAEAQYLLGRQFARSGRHAEAIPYFERAIAILPRADLFRAARESSREALRMASPQPTVGVRTPDSWNRDRGDTSVTGVLEHVDCLGAEARIAVLNGGEIQSLLIRNPTRVLANESTAAQVEFRCGPQQPPSPVEVRYFSASGEVTALRFLPR
jgi:tetratricopeptide (TPR) repeat protein